MAVKAQNTPVMANGPQTEGPLPKASMPSKLDQPVEEKTSAIPVESDEESNEKKRTRAETKDKSSASGAA